MFNLSSSFFLSGVVKSSDKSEIREIRAGRKLKNKKSNHRQHRRLTAGMHRPFTGIASISGSSSSDRKAPIHCGRQSQSLPSRTITLTVFCSDNTLSWASVGARPRPIITLACRNRNGVFASTSTIIYAMLMIRRNEVQSVDASGL